MCRPMAAVPGDMRSIRESPMLPAIIPVLGDAASGIGPLFTCCFFSLYCLFIAAMIVIPLCLLAFKIWMIVEVAEEVWGKS